MNTAYLDMIQGKNPGVTPVWYMRQAGRSQAEYRKIKEKYTLFEITKEPELCARVTELPVKEYGVDAAILYKDIMSPMVAMNVNVELKAGVGPVFSTPIRSMADVDKLETFDPTKVDYIAKTITLLTSGMLDVPLIGFCGAPFTIASYLIEGGPTKNYNKTRGMLIGAPDMWNALMTKLADMSIAYLSMQAEAGANALQIFDSWVGAVNADQYKQGIYPHMERIIKTVKAKYPHLPMAMNGVGTDHLVSIWSHLPLDVIALDWRSSIVMANERGVTQTVQGNLDPAYLFGDEKTLAREVDRILLDGVRYGRKRGKLVKVEKKGLLFLSYGSPLSKDDLVPYMTSIRRGRVPTEAELINLTKRYDTIGQWENIELQTMAECQYKTLLTLLPTMPSAIGFLHMKPSIADAVDCLVQQGVEHIIAIVTAPFFTALGTGAYEKQVQAAISNYDTVTFDFIRSWWDQPTFKEYWVKALSSRGCNQ